MNKDNPTKVLIKQNKTRLFNLILRMKIKQKLYQYSLIEEITNEAQKYTMGYGTND